MPFVSQLEPEALVRHFLRHPPEDFAADTVVGGMPGFVAPFDLLTTADPALRARVSGLPGYRRWSRWLQPRTRFVGTTVSEYAWLPASADPAALAGELVDTHGRECPFLIVKDIPQDSPLLDAHGNAWCDAFAEACADRGFVLLEGQALAWVPIDFENVDAYLARLSKGARKDIRRKLRAREQLQVETVATGDPRFGDPQVRAAFMRLYAAVYAQSEIHFDRLTEAFFRDVLQDGDSGGVVFVYRREGEMIGWNLCYRHGDALVDKYVGFAYPQARECNLYAVSWMHNLEYARTQGLRRYIAGWTDPEVKAHLGARMTFTRHAVRPRNLLLRGALKRLSRHFESDRHWYEEKHAHAPGGA
ncbi:MULTISPECIES: GNAT family N-acetyltransferase [Oleiagrimonas]|uniref:GNAT family N-acetyltransferase n=1 Tax=Oleiagrimonas citrea TaxID=1665687 RepID=A0A846ZJV4_9GAMM|nr:MULTISPECIES: GNAT family N-acetyltransferase [Oleiagrimonas]NKZ37997.1 GNAT family N-acetyltransferase [Oleiagrimonas citrea]RAP57480.1 GNAT family N-acetyltransferase [Oleiagrimonas sp. MCCC 1A03011]